MVVNSRFIVNLNHFFESQNRKYIFKIESIMCLDPVKILFIGMPGSGKSSTINILYGSNVCKAGKTLMLNGITKSFQDCNVTLQMEFEITGNFIIFFKIKD